MKKKLNLLGLITSFLLPFNVLASCQIGELIKPASKFEKNLLLQQTALMLPKTGVYDDGQQHLVFEDKASDKQRIYQYYGETTNNFNLAVNDADPLSTMKGKDAIELRKDDSVVVDLNFVNHYRQANQKKGESIKLITDFTDVWYKYFTIFDTKTTGIKDSWHAVNQALWTEDISAVNNDTNHKLVYNVSTDSYFASIKALQDVFKLETEYQQEKVFELKLASDKHHLFITCHYDQTFVHDYFTFSFIDLDTNNKRIISDEKNQSYQKLWESSYIICNLDKAIKDIKDIIETNTGWTSIVLEDLKKDKWLGYLMGTKSIHFYLDSVKPRYYNSVWYTPAAVHKNSTWYYYAKYTALGVEGFKGYSKKVEPIKIGS